MVFRLTEALHALVFSLKVRPADIDRQYAIFWKAHIRKASGACLKNHYCQLHTPLCGICGPAGQRSLLYHALLVRLPHLGQISHIIRDISCSKVSYPSGYSLWRISCPLGTSDRKHFLNTLRSVSEKSFRWSADPHAPLCVEFIPDLWGMARYSVPPGRPHKFGMNISISCPSGY